MSQPRVLFVAQYILVEGAMHSGKKAQCILVEGAMHSGKNAQCILVKSDEFENRTPFYIYFLNPVYVAARSLRSLRSNYELEISIARDSGLLIYPVYACNAG